MQPAERSQRKIRSLIIEEIKLLPTPKTLLVRGLLAVSAAGGAVYFLMHGLS
jgi:hypothetical protein